MREWSWCGDRHKAPKSLEGIEEDTTIAELLKWAHAEAEALYLAKAAWPVAFVAEAGLEAEEGGITMDAKDDEDLDAEIADGVRELLASEEEMLDERERRKAWLALPKKARVAIRRMHEEWGHMPSSVMIEILKLAIIERLVAEGLDGNRPGNLRVLAQIDHAHGTTANLPLNFIAPQGWTTDR